MFVLKGHRHAGGRLLTKKEKTWFFLLCGKQAKINGLIFLVIYSVRSLRNAFASGLSSVWPPACRWFFFAKKERVRELNFPFTPDFN